MQDGQKPQVDDKPKGFPPMEGVVMPPRKKSKEEIKLEAANKKDLSERNIK